jgi:3-hydroxyacyl-[acyl-carrier-protein] dehydratase
MVLRGKFCAEGTTRFALEYSEPAPLRIRFNENYPQRYDRRQDGGHGSRKRAFAAPSLISAGRTSIGNLKKNFTITVQEDSRDFEMKLVPRSDAFRRRLNYVVVKLNKRDFLLRSLEVDGKSGVNSVFAIDVSSVNPKIPAETFEVYKPKVIERSEIETMIPHRSPFLWIDRVEELEPGVRCVAVKFVDPADPIFAGHFPAKPILPGVLLIEAVAQTAGVMLGSAAPQVAREGVALLAAVNRFKFFKPVTPGQEVRIETKKLTDAGQMALHRRHGVGGRRDRSERRVVGGVGLMVERTIERMTERATVHQDGKGHPVIGKFKTHARQFATALLKEKLDPGRAAAAVFLGIFIGIVPIYGFQTLAAVGLALVFKLNKPLTMASTFINNPLLQPLIIVSSVELGCFLRHGSFRPFHLSALTGAHMKRRASSLGDGQRGAGDARGRSWGGDYRSRGPSSS